MGHGIEQSKASILRAAAAEFSSYGIAGARVDRIVAAAGCGKGLVYHYFGSKDELFDAVYDALVAETVEALAFDPEDMAGYAVALFDYVQANPQVVRLMSWFELERGEDPVPAAIVRSQRRKAEAVAKAQASGLVNDAIPGEELLAALVAVALSGPTRRDSVRHAVTRLVDPN